MNIRVGGYMKKIVILLCLLVFTTGCTISKIDVNHRDNMLKVALEQDINLFNRVSKGYKYYLPKGISLLDYKEYNETLIEDVENIIPKLKDEGYECEQCIKEKRDLYDLNKNLTNEVINKGDTIPKNRKVLIVAIWIEDLNGNFLIQKRKKGEFWSITSGHPKAGETSLEGIITEAKEELNHINLFFL